MKKLLSVLFAVAWCLPAFSQPTPVAGPPQASNAQASAGTATGVYINPYQLKTYGGSGGGAAIHGTPTAGQGVSWFDATHVQGFTYGTNVTTYLTTPTWTNFLAATTGTVPYDTAGSAAARQAAFTILTTLGNLANSAGALTNSGTGALSYVVYGTGNALTANPLSQFAATTSAQLYGVISDETGSASGSPLLVFNQNPTLAGYTLTAQANVAPTTITVTSHAGTISATKPLQTASDFAACTLTFSAVGTLGDITTIQMTNSDVAAAHAFAVKQFLGGALESVTVPANSMVSRSYQSSGAAWAAMTGIPTIADFPADTTPATTKYIETDDATTGAPGKSTIAQVVGANAANPTTATVGLAAVNGSATTFMRSDGAPPLNVTIAPTWTGVHTFTPAVRTSGVASYFTVTTPADTGQTASTASIGFNLTAGTRTWADGTVAAQYERWFGAPTYNKTTTAATFTDVFNLGLATPVAGSGVTFTRPHTLGIIGATSAASSITGELVVAATLGTTATSVGIGGGNVNAGGNGTFGGTLSATGHVTFEGVTSTGATGTGKLVYDGAPVLASVSTSAGAVASIDGAQTLTNKRVTARSHAVTYNASPTWVSDTYDYFTFDLSGNITNFTTNLTGTPVAGDQLLVRLYGNGGARTLTAWGTKFAARGAALLTTVPSGKYCYALFIWNEITSTWDCVSTATEA
ncbi:MAG TPA: hypothetical protein VMQ76_05565 [Terracidiphilus sp.]|nr:hypothetical protein [Terracidiphilus sp.]